ncbi:MAG: hypothetical protein LBR54_00765 [Oscillospiraceae bacterium]|jgi:hypothetical protein|nr:hypothetical protein [Oscillospiraceae bacterium]
MKGRKMKKAAALITAGAALISLAGCTVGTNTAVAVTIDGYKVDAGVYIYESFRTFNDALNRLSLEAGEGEEIDTENIKELKKKTVDGKPMLEWIQDETTRRLTQLVGIERKFGELGLELSAEEQAEIDYGVSSQYEPNEKMFKGNGVSEKSMRTVLENAYKTDKVFMEYYKTDGGIENVKEDAVKDFYAENNARIKLIEISLLDKDTSEPLDDEKKAEAKDRATDYYTRLKSGADMNELIEEHEAYVAQAEETEPEESGTETSSEETASGSNSDTSGSAGETSVSSAGETSVSSAEETSVSSAGETSVSSAGETSVSSAGETSISSAGETESGNSDETTAETTPETTPETTTDPFTYETVVHSATLAEDEKEIPDSRYVPSKKSNEELFKSTEPGVHLIEEEDKIYVIEKTDIRARMKEDDLWTESTVESTLYDMYYLDFEEMLDGWCVDYTVSRNMAAYKRYDPFKFDTSDAAPVNPY